MVNATKPLLCVSFQMQKKNIAAFLTLGSAINLYSENLEIERIIFCIEILKSDFDDLKMYMGKLTIGKRVLWLI